MAAKDVGDADFDREVMASPVPVVVDFWAPWCGPCKQIAPALDEISAEMGGRVVVAKVNVDDCPGVASRFGIRSVPTLLVVKGGELVDQKVGAASKAELTRWIGQHLG